MTAERGYFQPNFIPPVGAIIQARLDSERFPRKMFADLNGKPVLQWVIERVRASRLVHHIVVATPDKEICQFAESLGVWGRIENGDPNNVLARYMNTANWAGSEVVVRITGDCPLIDPEIIDNTIKGYLDNRVDISTNVLRRTFAKGMDVEVMHRNVLKRMFHLSDDPKYREHVTLFCYDNPQLFRINSIMDNNDYSRFNLSVDTPKDIDRIKEILSCVSGDVNYQSVIRQLVLRE